MRQLPLFDETPKRSKAKATTKYLRNCLPRILSITHRNQAVSPQIAMEHETSTKPYAQPSRFSRRNPLANFGWRSRDNVQNVPRDAPRRVLGHSPNGKDDSIRDCRCHASAKRQDQRSLGSGEPVFARAAVRTYSSTKEGIADLPTKSLSFVTRDILYFLQG